MRWAEFISGLSLGVVLGFFMAFCCEYIFWMASKHFHQLFGIVYRFIDYIRNREPEE